MMLRIHHDNVMEDCYKELLKLFSELVVFVHYNYTENKLELSPKYSYMTFCLCLY